MPATYTVRITFDRAKNLPVADIGTLSSDPYVLAFISSPEHLDLEPLTFRTPTIRRTRDPVWNSSWILGGVPETGFKLSMVLYDEDPGAKISPDRLGKATARFGAEQIKEGWELVEHEYVLQKRKGDLHPYLLTYFVALLPGEKLLKHNRVVVSVRVLAKDGEMSEDSRIYTLGPNRYSRHFSPLIGSMVNKHQTTPESEQMDGKRRRLSATTFVANKFQLTGPVPRELRHRYVGYRPFIDWMFTDTGIAGHLLHYGLRKQYRTIYACDKSTVWGVVEAGVNKSNTEKPNGQTDIESQEEHPSKPTSDTSEALARQFLEMVSWGEGNKLFTYVITLDGEWRFTETGPEFAIDLLSKHSMHANLAKEIAYSGEFFVQPLAENIPGQVDGCLSSTQRSEATKSSADRNPRDYELVIDNDSGTYRPKKELLPVFQEWLADDRRLGGLGRVRTMDGFDENLKKMKEERQKARTESRKHKPEKMVPVRMSSDGANSISSGELERESVSGERIDQALKEVHKS
uniref:C2 domain-containing protein n=1 Tax=Mycena chlorophos TaxID=658473 RepID=A0ABQ0LSH0_MYCCL|nr:predicted protein [Mycena chlorophos]